MGGHSYGWVYSGPMGAVLIPGILGIDNAGDLPNASTLCGKCESICPMRIPIPRMLRAWRTKQFNLAAAGRPNKLALIIWAQIAKRPFIYKMFSRTVVFSLRLIGRMFGKISWLPLGKGWTLIRDFPIPQGETFLSQHKKSML